MPNTRHAWSISAIGAALWVASASVAVCSVPDGAATSTRGTTRAEPGQRPSRSLAQPPFDAETDPSPPPAGEDRPTAAAVAEGERDLLQEALPCLRSVLERAVYGVSHYEAAAWLVESRQAGGEVACVAWPQTEEDGMALWSGPVPRGVLALVHSHPVRKHLSAFKPSPRPSEQDCKTARQLRIPVLTVSLAGVYGCRPADGRIVLHLQAGWERTLTPE